MTASGNGAGTATLTLIVSLTSGVQTATGSWHVRPRSRVITNTAIASGPLKSPCVYPSGSLTRFGSHGAFPSRTNCCSWTSKGVKSPSQGPFDLTGVSSPTRFCASRLSIRSFPAILQALRWTWVYLIIYLYCIVYCQRFTQRSHPLKFLQPATAWASAP